MAYITLGFLPINFHAAGDFSRATYDSTRKQPVFLAFLRAQSGICARTCRLLREVAACIVRSTREEKFRSKNMVVGRFLTLVVKMEEEIVEFCVFKGYWYTFVSFEEGMLWCTGVLRSSIFSSLFFFFNLEV